MIRNKIAIIGCGPKALAIAAKAKVLEELGYNVPEIVILEKHKVGASWSGKHGYTDGKCNLGISPLKDIGYPYQSIFGNKVDMLMGKYSFTNYLKDKNLFTLWVDNGNPAITHNDFSLYLKWVSNKIDIKIITGEAVELIPENRKWKIIYKNHNKTDFLHSDSVVITGPGDALNISGLSNTYDAQNFWSNIDTFNNISGQKIALIGSGTSAGAIFGRLMPLLGNNSSLDWHTKRGVFNRSENLSNNQIYSHIEKWLEIPANFRKEYALHTDRSVIESHVNQTMAAYKERFSIVFSNSKKINFDKNKLEIIYDDVNGETAKKYDKIINATGFHSLSFLNLLSESFRNENDLTGPEEEFLDRIDEDLSIRGLISKLHVPMLGWYKYGIGLRNLSCLSTLSDKILKSYVNIN